MKKNILVLSITFVAIIFILFGVSQFKKWGNGLPQNEIISIQSDTYYNDILIIDLGENDIKNIINTKLTQLLPLFTLVESEEKFGEIINSDDIKDIFLVIKDEKAATFHDEEIKYYSYNLPETELEKLKNVKNSYSVVFGGKTENIYEKQLSIYQALHTSLMSQNILIIENNTRNVFTLDTWKEKRINHLIDDNSIATGIQTKYHFYQVDDFCRIVTLGMEKFGLPDISIQGVPCSVGSAIGGLVSLITQTLLEKPYVEKGGYLTLNIDTLKNKSVKNNLKELQGDNPTGKVKIQLTSVEIEEGDNYNSQLLVLFDDPKYLNSQEQIYDNLFTVFGTDDKIYSIQHNPEVLAISEKARERLPELERIFNHSMETGSTIMLKAPFQRDDQGYEWMWIEVLKWDKKEIKGILTNKPYYIKNLNLGAIVNVNQDDIFDYILFKADGTSEGNETKEMLEKQ